MSENNMEPIPESVTERITELDEETFNFLQKDFPDVGWDKDALEKFLGSPDNILLIAKKNNEGVGMIRGHLLHRYDGKGTEALLHELDVLPEHQGQGLGTVLIEKFKELAKETGAKEVWLVTNRSNTAAMKVYEKTGGKTSHEDDVVFSYELE